MTGPAHPPLPNEAARPCFSESLTLSRLEMVSEEKNPKALLLMYNSRLPLYTIIVLMIKSL